MRYGTKGILAGMPWATWLSLIQHMTFAVLRQPYQW